jgi:hypothetical protein
MATSTESSIGTQLGLGANISAQYFLNPTVYAYGRFQLFYDFHAISGGSSRISTFGMNPCIGIGLKR